MDVWPAPRGPGPYGMHACREGAVYYASLVGHYVGRIDAETGSVTVLEPPTANQGARRVWCDSRSRVWVAEWDAGRLGLYDPASGGWRERRLPGSSPQAYAVHVDERDIVWLTEFNDPALVRFDPATERFDVFRWPTGGAFVRQLLSRPGELWGAESNTNKLVVFRDR
jgi:virginiamycin B lyase